MQQSGESEKDKDFKRASTTMKIQIDLSDQQNVVFPSASLGDSLADPVIEKYKLPPSNFSTKTAP